MLIQDCVHSYLVVLANQEIVGVGPDFSQDLIGKKLGEVKNLLNKGNWNYVRKDGRIRRYARPKRALALNS